MSKTQNHATKLIKHLRLLAWGRVAAGGLIFCGLNSMDGVRPSILAPELQYFDGVMEPLSSQA